MSVDFRLGRYQDVLADATQLTWFEDDGVTYRVAATPRLPATTAW